MRIITSNILLIFATFTLASCVSATSVSSSNTKWALREGGLSGVNKEGVTFNVSCENFTTVSIEKSKIRGFSVSAGVFLAQHNGQNIIQHETRGYTQGAFVGTGSKSKQNDEKIRQLIRVISKGKGTLFVSFTESSNNNDLSFEGIFDLAGSAPLVKRLFDRCPVPKQRIGI